MPYYGTHRLVNKHAVWRAVALSTAFVLVALVGIGAVTFRHLDGNIDRSDAISTLDDSARPQALPIEVEAGNSLEPTKPLNVLIMGSDSRKGQTTVGGVVEPPLSDVTILLHLSADRSRAYGISIPRDLIVERPDCPGRDGKSVAGETVAQWNAAFALGGESCTITQFEAMTDIRLDHFVTIDFNGFKGMVDAVGGVPVCLPEEVNDPIGRIYLKAGSYTVSGDEALDYVRVRHSIGTLDTGDLGRLKRQQAFMASMVAKVVSAGTLLNPVKLTRFLDAATKSLTVDEDLKFTELVSMGQQVSSIGLNRVQFLSMPFTTYAPDPNRLAPDVNAPRMWDLVKRDRPLGPEFTKDAAKASAAKGSGKKKKKTPEQQTDAAVAGLCA